MTTAEGILENSLLGKKIAYIDQYKPELLFSIPRQLNRERMGIALPLPFNGVDIWYAFEISWLNEKGKPLVAIGEFIFPCAAPNLIESKSFKLYLNSFNQTNFTSVAAVTEVLQKDLAQAAGAEVQVKLALVADYQWPPTRFAGHCLDGLDIRCDAYEVKPDFLQVGCDNVAEVVYSDLLKSHCEVTNQPDWASVQISYAGKQIDHAGLLKYLVSFRQHSEFHEPCTERIFMDILQRCQPSELTVYARYTRRGGLDINPYRSTRTALPGALRLARQ
jgi:7-cyano-7-deazaguanine reductase